MVAADADADGLIDGASRFDRFSEDRAVRTTIHLAALWGAALEAIERLSAARGGDDTPETAEALTLVRAILNDASGTPTSVASTSPSAPTDRSPAPARCSLPCR